MHKTQTEAQIIARRLRELRAEMKAAGIKKTSCFNGGMDRETQRYNERRFALETELKTAKKKAAVAKPDPAFQDISHISEYGLTQKLSSAIRCF